MKQSEAFTPELGEHIGADYLLERDSSPEEWLLAFEQYFGAEFGYWQLQAQVTAEQAQEAYRNLLDTLSAHENELGLLYRTGGQGQLLDEGYFGTSSSANQIEDVIIFQIHEPKLLLADLSGFDSSDNNRPNGYKSLRGITLSQPLVAYALRTTRAGDWHRYFPETPNSRLKFHDLEPVDGVITLSYIDQYFDHRYPASHRGLEYALADSLRYPSISVSPVRYDKHMRLHAGNEAVATELSKQSWFTDKTREQAAEILSRPPLA